MQGTPSSNEESYKWLAEDSAKAKVTVSPRALLLGCEEALVPMATITGQAHDLIVTVAMFSLAQEFMASSLSCNALFFRRAGNVSTFLTASYHTEKKALSLLSTGLLANSEDSAAACPALWTPVDCSLPWCCCVQWPKVLNAPLSEVDPELEDIIEHEKNRQWKVRVKS